MADRGNVQRRGATTNLVGRTGQTTNGLPPGYTESAIPLAFNLEGREVFSTEMPRPELDPITMPKDDIDSKYSSQVSKTFGFIGITEPTDFNITGGGGGAIIYYKMRGWYPIGGVYETWIVTGSPSTSPPSGHTLTDVVIAATWQA